MCVAIRSEYVTWQRTQPDSSGDGTYTVVTVADTSDSGYSNNSSGDGVTADTADTTDTSDSGYNNDSSRDRETADTAITVAETE